jgi:glycosyltransferase involved in cell wall biosynthesis
MNTFAIPERKITMVPNAVQLDEPLETRSQWRKKLGVDENRFLAVMVANLQPFKDHPTLLESWRRVIDRTGSTEPPILLLAGRFGQTYQQLRFMAEELQLGDSIRFLGEVKDIPGLLGAVDLCVFSSKFEGCPNGVLEPMAAGLPVVATHITGIAEALGTDYQFFVPINKTERFAEHILTFISNETLRRETGERNRQRAADRFKPDRMFRAYLTLLKKLI